MRVQDHTARGVRPEKPTSTRRLLLSELKGGSLSCTRICVGTGGGQCSVPKPASAPIVSRLQRPIPGGDGAPRKGSESPELPACFPAVMAASLQSAAVSPVRESARARERAGVVALSLPTAAQVSRFLLQTLSSIPLCRPHRKAAPQEFPAASVGAAQQLTFK